MKNFLALLRKEFEAYLFSILAYIFIVVVLVLANWLFFQNFFVINQSSLRGFFALIPWFFLFFIPALAMRTWSDEKKSGTIETLLTLPYSEWQVILAKFAAGVLFILLMLLFSLPLPFSIANLGSLDTGQVIGQYLAALFLGSAIFAIGMWLSSLTKNPIVSFILTVALTFVLIIIGVGFISAGSSFFVRIFQGFSLLTHYESMTRGVVDLRDVFYFVSLTFLFLYLTAFQLNRRNWK